MQNEVEKTTYLKNILCKKIIDCFYHIALTITLGKVLHYWSNLLFLEHKRTQTNDYNS